jgi:mediator of RNA polymerase II transcription subunit 23
LSLAHSLWHHAGFTQIQQLADLVRDKFVPLVRTEEQLIFVYHLVRPFQLMSVSRTRVSAICTFCI